MNEIYKYIDTLSAFACGDSGRKNFNSLLRIHGKIEKTKVCPFCSSVLKRWGGISIEDIRHNIYRDWDYNELYYVLIICSACGWYRYRIVDCSDFSIPVAGHRISVFSKSDVSDESIPITEIKRYLIKNWQQRKLLTPNIAEKLIADIFKEYLDCEIRYFTNGVYSPDGGIDFVLINSNKGLEYAFQVKRRISDSPEPVTEVRQFLGAMASSPFKHGYYVTTADRFTRSTIKEIQSSEKNIQNHNLSINIVDGTDLFKILQSHKLLPQTAIYLRDNLNFIADWFPLDIRDDHGPWINGYPQKKCISFLEVLALTFP